MFLSGDRKLTTNGVPVHHGILVLTTNQIIGWTQEIHQGSGNIAFADGHVQPLNKSDLNQALQAVGSLTNRLVIP
jgi:prepilin-type processing-associated H-X9-DG protein